MNFQEIIKIIMEVVVIPLFPLLTAYLIKLIQAKKEQFIADNDNQIYHKYMNMLAETISKCVVATNQTYVDALKQKNEFTAEAQKEAFVLTYNAVLDILSKDAKDYLINAVGDFQQYLNKAIEAEVKWNK